MPRKPPPPLGLTLTILRSAQGWSQKELAEATGLSRGVICEYEKGTTELTRDRLETLAVVLGWPSGSVDRFLFGLGLARPSPEEPVSPVDPDEEERRIIDRAAAVGAREAAEALRADLIRDLRQEKADQARRAAEALWLKLKPLSGAARQARVTQDPDYQDPFLCERLCAESVKTAATDAGRSKELAELALMVAERVPGQVAWRSRLQGYAWSFLGNARRVAGHLPSAEEAFTSAWKFWRIGAAADPGVFTESLLLDLTASLRRSQARFVEALELHERALVGAKPKEAGHLLLNKAATLVESGDHERSIETLEQAARFIDGRQEPRQVFAIRFNQAANLLQLGHLAAAELRLAEAREFALSLGNELDLVRVVWLDGRMNASRGKRQDAIAAFEQVRREFLAREIAYDFALVSLELAALYLEDRRTVAVKALAQQMVVIFGAQKVHREALAAVKLFREAAEKEELTVEMIRRLVEYLTRARHAPELRFEI